MQRGQTSHSNKPFSSCNLKATTGTEHVTIPCHRLTFLGGEEDYSASSDAKIFPHSYCLQQGSNGSGMKRKIYPLFYNLQGLSEFEILANLLCASIWLTSLLKEHLL